MAEPELAKRKHTLVTSAIAVKISENHNPEALVLPSLPYCLIFWHFLFVDDESHVDYGKAVVDGSWTHRQPRPLTFV